MTPSDLAHLSDLPLWAALPAALLLVAGSLLALIGSFGLLRLPHLYARLHGPAMGSTLGLYCVLAAFMLVASVAAQRPVLQPLLIAVFIVLTSPATAVLLMQAALYRDRRRVEK
jgi:multicomponent K+:H+ antiporter subunit G